jgi:flagellum-specific ATP synthase
VNGLLIEARGSLTRLGVGARAEIVRRDGKPLAAEVVGFRESRALLMPFGPRADAQAGQAASRFDQKPVHRRDTAGHGQRIDPLDRVQ